jgi:hypothetical protein
VDLEGEEFSGPIQRTCNIRGLAGYVRMQAELQVITEGYDVDLARTDCNADPGLGRTHYSLDQSMCRNVGNDRFRVGRKSAGSDELFVAF